MMMKMVILVYRQGDQGGLLVESGWSKAWVLVEETVGLSVGPCVITGGFSWSVPINWGIKKIPKMKAYDSDPDDLKLDPSYQETWDDMIIYFLAGSVDVIQDTDWVISQGNAFTKQYALYIPDDEHSALPYWMERLEAEWREGRGGMEEE
ncbi:hypothetical protein CRYUN_Cryun05aG0220800 [Craigia yunnanensis]